MRRESSQRSLSSVGDAIRTRPRAIAVLASLVVTLAVAGTASAEDTAESEATEPEKEELVLPKVDIDDLDSTTANQDDGKKKVIVVRRKKNGREDAPEVGASELEIQEYLADFTVRERELKERMRDARREGNDAEADALSEELRDLKRERKDEQARLTKRNGGLIGGGATLIGVGSLSVVVGLVFAVVYAVDNSPASGVGPTAVGCLVGGVVGIGAGAPMLAIGLKRVPREPSDDYAALVPQTPFQSGATLTWSF